jgi:hypothetical protein
MEPDLKLEASKKFTIYVQVILNQVKYLGLGQLEFSQPKKNTVEAT